MITAGYEDKIRGYEATLKIKDESSDMQLQETARKIDML
jgi:hypothetical protein